MKKTTIDFGLAEHQWKPVKIVEILLHGKVVGVIYPEGEDGIKIMSAHFSEKTEGGEVIPTITITFKPRKYTVEDGKIRYLE